MWPLEGLSYLPGRVLKILSASTVQLYGCAPVNFTLKTLTSHPQSALKLNFACSQKHPILGCCARLRQPGRFYAA
eukprot:COSAG01_NODE_69666_length_260_cov_3.111801_1_plen_74_part_10